MIKRTFWIFAALFLPAFSPCFAATISVSPESQYQTIQAAVDAAGDGDTILVVPGVYLENVNIMQKRRLTLRADKSDFANSTTTDAIIEAADPSRPAIELLYADSDIVEGFILRGAANNAGIRLGYAASNVKIINNVIESNYDGINIDYYSADSSEVTRNIFRGNANFDINLPAQFCWPTGAICQSKDNKIYLNDFYGQATTSGSSYVNYWSSKEEYGYDYKNQLRVGKLGNYWARCVTEDLDGDGIGDTPCNINQSNYDRYPLVAPISNYDVVDPEVISGNQEWQDKVVDKPVVIPFGSKLTIKKGATINFQTGGAIFANGDLLIKGTVKNPVKLVGENGYSGKLISVGNTGTADLRNAEMIASLVDGLPARQTAVSVAGAGKLEMQACRVSGNAAGVEMSQIGGGNIKINRSKFSNNIIDVANNNPADSVLPDFKYNWWGSQNGPDQSHIAGSIDSANWIARENFRDPVVLVPGIVGSWPENGELKIDPIFHSFDGLVAELKANGYVEGIDLFYFPYQWRESNVNSALSLAGLIQKVKTDTNMPKVDIVAHSMGGLVARQYIEADYYKIDVDQLITLATPNNGSPQSYLLWEGGDIEPSIIGSVYKAIFEQEAKENHYPDLLSYVRGRVPSAAQLLPIYNYLYEGNTNILRFYPNNYPQNLFLENLNLTENVKKIEIIEYDKIVANLVNGQSTITGFNVATSTQLPKWQHGYPIDYDIPFGPRGMIKGEGDGTVPLVSAQSMNIPEDEIITITSDHSNTMVAGRQDVLELLTGYRPQGVEINWHIPNLMLVQVFSPVDIQIVAPDGKWSGKNIINLPETDRISGAYYTGFDTDAEFITVPNPSGKYKIITQGTGSGDFTVETTLISQGGGNSQTQETSAVIQGTATLGREDQFAVQVVNGVVTEESDIIAPVIEITSPKTGNTYLNNLILPINYQATDDKTLSDKIEVDVYLDNATTTESAIDLAFQKTGFHKFEVKAQDEAGNIGQKESSFIVVATVDSIIANVGHYANLGLMKEIEKTVLISQLKILKSQFGLLGQVKNNTKLSAGAKKIVINALTTSINGQIDVMIKGINLASVKLINVNVSELLIDDLKYIKIKS